ncbi:hypothetical protein E2C01_045018 [Portunus trituberculatus]|uniref:Uncharacterized protein n=1 Tax=Portunus trituberculatus TaxID=210409 RepID=A0A5B7G207_PORTR|nr:hypothetical protein [Portunus trituberculatus]
MEVVKMVEEIIVVVVVVMVVVVVVITAVVARACGGRIAGCAAKMRAELDSGRCEANIRVSGCVCQAGAEAGQRAGQQDPAQVKIDVGRDVARYSRAPRHLTPASTLTTPPTAGPVEHQHSCRPRRFSLPPQLLPTGSTRAVAAPRGLQSAASAASCECFVRAPRRRRESLSTC